MESTLAVLNELVTHKIVEKYAIGGAVAAIFWAEPFDTIDLDIFVLLPASAPPLEPLRDVVAFLRKRGYEFEGEFINVEGVPVQFLPADDRKGLGTAAMAAAAKVDYSSPLGTVPTFVITPEYLIALALDVHRSKDYDRVSKLLTHAKVDRNLVEKLIATYGLEEQWSTFLRRYPEFA